MTARARGSYSALLCTLLLLVPVDPGSGQEPREGSVESPSQQGEAEALKASEALRRKANVEGTASQERIDALSSETDVLFARYSSALRQIDSTRVYNRQMRELIASQTAELASLAEQNDRVEVVGRSVTPMMLRMIDALAAFIALDLPFLREEREDRVAELRELMIRADLSNAEKYRAIMEAYQTENEYGRTIEAYRSSLERDGKEVTVDFLRFGRIALVYQALDESEAGVWSKEKRAWVPLDRSYRSSIRDGLRIARRQAAPDLVRLPLPTLDGAGGG